MRQRKNQAKRREDFREFVFTATGKAVDIKNLTMIDVYDNLIVEADRLEALAELLMVSDGEVDNRVLGGVALLLKDIQARMKAVLGCSLPKERNRKTRGK